LGKLVMSMLAKDPKQRPRSMREVIDELDSALNDTLTFDFETLSGSGMSIDGQKIAAAARAQAALDADRSFVWTPDAKDRRASPDRRGRRKEDLASRDRREPTISSDWMDPTGGDKTHVYPSPEWKDPAGGDKTHVFPTPEWKDPAGGDKTHVY